MAEKVVSKLRGNMWRLIILAVAGSLGSIPNSV